MSFTSTQAPKLASAGASRSRVGRHHALGRAAAPATPAGFNIPHSACRGILKNGFAAGLGSRSLPGGQRRNVSLAALRDGDGGGRSFPPEPPAGDSYLSATVDRVGVTEKGIPVMFLKMPNENLVLPILIGEAESTALANELRHKHAPRPMTHDLFKDSITALGAKVSKVFITDLVNNTYRATLVCLDKTGEQVVIDARPSDAINLAVRFGAPIFVSREVAGESAYDIKDHPYTDSTGQNSAFGRSDEVERTLLAVQDAFVTYRDPTTELRALMAVAAAEERYDDAIRLRDEIERVTARDRTTTLVVAMQHAVEDQRYDEAKVLVEEFHLLQRSKLEADAKKRNVP